MPGGRSDPKPSWDAIIKALETELARARQALTRQGELNGQLLRAEATIPKLKVGELWQFSLFFYSSSMAQHPEWNSYWPLPPDEQARVWSPWLQKSALEALRLSDSPHHPVFHQKSWRRVHMCSDADKWVNVEATMREKGVGWILCELAGGKETEIQWTSIIQLSMVFSQEGHLMLNEKS